MKTAQERVEVEAKTNLSWFKKFSDRKNTKISSKGELPDVFLCIDNIDVVTKS